MRRLLLQLAMALGVTAASAVVARSEEGSVPEVDQPQVSVEVLVQMLGDELFATRERATTRLIEIGFAAKDALERGTQHPDREIRYRCIRILELVEENDFQRRLAAFAAGRDDQHGLPGWERYQERFGGEAEARALFVEMQKNEPEIMRSIDADPQAVGRTLDVRCIQIQQIHNLSRQPVPLGSIAAMLFAVSDEEVKVQQTAGSRLASFFYQAAVQNAMNDSGQRPILRHLLGDWVKRGDSWAALQNLSLSMRYDLKEGLVVAREIVENPGTPAHIRQNAILVIAKLGDPSDVAVLENLLEDQTRCATQRIQDKTYQTQLRDVALAAILLMEGKDPKDFGFDRIQRNDVSVFVTGTVGFISDQERLEALEKFRQARAEEKTGSDAS